MRGSVKAWVLAFVLAAGGGFAALVGIGCAIGANECPFGADARIEGTDGKHIYLTTCSACHGPDGQGGSGPTLVGGTAGQMKLDELEARISRGRPLAGMPRFKGELTPAQIEAVARYVLQLREER